jgi:hypothetical protein
MDTVKLTQNNTSYNIQCYLANGRQKPYFYGDVNRFPASFSRTNMDKFSSAHTITINTLPNMPCELVVFNGKDVEGKELSVYAYPKDFPGRREWWIIDYPPQEITDYEVAMKISKFGKIQRGLCIYNEWGIVILPMPVNLPSSRELLKANGKIAFAFPGKNLDFINGNLYWFGKDNRFFFESKEISLCVSIIVDDTCKITSGSINAKEAITFNLNIAYATSFQMQQ